MSEKIVLLLCNAPTACAADLARAVVGERLAACVNLLPEVQSVYHWQGQLEEARETPLLAGNPVAMQDHRLGGAGLDGAAGPTASV